MKENKLSRFREVMDSLGQGRRTEITLGDLFGLADIFQQTPSQLLASYGYEGPYLCQGGHYFGRKKEPLTNAAMWRDSDIELPIVYHKRRDI